MGIERAENVARFIDVNINLMLDYPVPVNEQQWMPLVSVSGDDEELKKRFGTANEEKVLKFLTFDIKNPNSILSYLHYARENARSIRDSISSEMWEQINSFYWFLNNQSKKRRIDDLSTFYSHVKKESHLFVGLTYDTMSHGEAWHFANLGRMLERADKTARMLDVKYFLLLPIIEQVDSPLDAVVWGDVLKSVSAFEMYRKKYNRIFYKNVIEFLVFDKDFSRSINFCLDQAINSLNTIFSKTNQSADSLNELNALKELILHRDVDTILNEGVHEFIDSVQFDLNKIDTEIFNTYFALRSINSD